MDSKKLAQLCRDFADNRKAEDVVVLDVRKISSITDYFVIISGTSEPHLRAIVDEITDRLREDHGIRARATDGSIRASWQVMDFFDVIVHIMRKDVREHYDLEGLWGDAPRVEVKAKAAPKPKLKAAKAAKAVKPPAKPKAKAAAKKKPAAK
jgi:ribosome-associated protein